MHVPADTLCPGLYVFLFKFDSRLVGVGYDEKIQIQRKDCNQRGGEYIWHHHPVETDSAGQDGYYFRICSHLRGEEYHRDEHEQWTEHVHEVWYEVYVVVKYDGPQRRFLADKVVDLLADVENDHDADDQQEGNEECRDELPYYI